MSKHILVFDSGLGGTTVLQELIKAMPGNRYSYALDNAAFPYGNKANSFLQNRIIRLFDELLARCQPDLAVIACNTASTLILETLRLHYPLPFVGVVPAIKPAAAISRSGVIGLLATEATVQRDYIKQLHEAHAAHCEMVRFATQRLVDIAEQKILGNPINHKALQEIAEAIQKHPLYDRIDTFILGCTHFPALREELANLFPPHIHWVDSGEAIARRARQLCADMPETTEQAPSRLFITRGKERPVLLQALKPFGLCQCDVIEID